MAASGTAPVNEAGFVVVTPNSAAPDPIKVTVTLAFGESGRSVNAIPPLCLGAHEASFLTSFRMTLLPVTS